MLKTFSWTNSPARTPDCTAESEMAQTFLWLGTTWEQSSFQQPTEKVQSLWPPAGWVSRGKGTLFSHFFHAASPPDELLSYSGASCTAVVPDSMKSNETVLCEGSTVLLLFQACLQTDPDNRATCSQLLGHPYFTWDGFHQRWVTCQTPHLWEVWGAALDKEIHCKDTWAYWAKH